MLQSTRGDKQQGYLGIQEQLVSFPEWNADLSRLRLTPKDVNAHIKKLEDFLFDSKESISFASEQYQTACNIIGCFDCLDDGQKLKLLNAIIAGFAEFTRKAFETNSKNNNNNQTGSDLYFQVAGSLESMSVLLFTVISKAIKSPKTPQDPSKKKNAATFSSSSWNHLKLMTGKAALSIATSKLIQKLYQSDSELEHVTMVLVKTIHLCLEDAEMVSLRPPSEHSTNHGAVSDFTQTSLQFLTAAVCRLRYGPGMKTVILQDLTYLEHLAVFNAKLVSCCLEAEHPWLFEQLLQHIGDMKFAADEGAAAKIIATFLQSLAKDHPESILRSLSCISDHLDSASPSMRMAIVEVFALITLYLATKEDRNEHTRSQSDTLLSTLLQRLRDVNAFVRVRVLTVLGELVSRQALPVSDRAALIEVVAGRIGDKSSNVRKKAIQLLGELIRTHPFCVDGGELALPFFEERLEETEAAIEAMQQVKEEDGENSPNAAMQVGEQENENSTPKAQSSINASTLLVQKRYYQDAIAFVHQVDKVMPALHSLLLSTTKGEVVEVMDFFVLADAYKVESAREGIQKMMHLVWEERGSNSSNNPGNPNENSNGNNNKNTIKDHLLSSYKQIFLETADAKHVASSPRERIREIVSKMCSLIGGGSVADLASLEQIIGGWMAKGWIPAGIHKLLYKTIIEGGAAAASIDDMESKETSQTEENNNHLDAITKRKAMILLCLMSKFDPSIVQERPDIFITSGMCVVGGDPWIAEHACIAISRLNAVKNGGKPGKTNSARLNNENIVITKLSALINECPVTAKWLQVCKEACSAIYCLASNPSKVMATILSSLKAQLRQENNNAAVSNRQGRSVLCKAIFIAGHVAVGEVGHLEVIQSRMLAGKRAELEQSKSENDDLDAVLASAQDEIVDALRYIREHELLFAPASLLAPFTRITLKILQEGHSTGTNQELLQIIAAQSLAKFMSVSERFCQENLSLFLTLLQKSEWEAVRANLTIAFADIAQAYARLIDHNIIFLFARLGDESVRVRRHALLVLTHLTLTGMIKVKGHVAHIARCILDEDEHVAQLARFFFKELAGGGGGQNGGGKDNIIYNHIPEIISALGAATSANSANDDDEVGSESSKIIDPIQTKPQIDHALPFEDFQKIAKFIFSFIKKEKQMEGLVEKLCGRFRLTTQIHQQRHLAYSLSLLSFGSDRTIRKFCEGYPQFKGALMDRQIYLLIGECLQKCRRGISHGGSSGSGQANKTSDGSVAGGELRAILDEFEQKLIAEHEGMCMDIDESGEEQEDVLSKSRKQKPQKLKSKRGTTRKSLVVSDEEEDSAFNVHSTEDEEDEAMKHADGSISLADKDENDDGVASGDEPLPPSLISTRKSKKLTTRSRTRQSTRKSLAAQQSTSDSADEDVDDSY